MTDEERDAHLRAALRHAPDAQLQPPPALSELILKEARAKARDASAPVRAPRHPLLGVWDWLARPSVATGFAGVMVATLIGLMWWDQPMDEAMPQPPAPAAAPAAPPAPVATTPPVAPIAEATRPAPATEPARAPQRKSAPAAKPAPAAAPAPEVAAREEAAAPVAREAAPPVALSAPPPAPAPAPAAAADTATAGAAATSRAKSLDESKRQRSMASADTLNQAAKTEARAEAREAEVRSSIGSVRTAIAAEPARWAWQRSSGAAAQGMNDAVYAWLAQLESATGTRWQPRAERDTAAPLGRELLLLRDGRVQHSLRLSEGGVWWESGPNTWQAELTAAQLTELQTALDQAAP